VLSHDQRRLRRHYLGHIDPERVAWVNLMIGVLQWAGLFGDPKALSPT
jgi:hypothetical protein